jgi:hypothetical protein
MTFVERLKKRWGVGPWGVLAIVVAFSLAGMTVVRLKGPVLGLIMPANAPNWVQWVAYLVIIFPLYQVLLLAYGTVLGQFDFFWKKLTAVGRCVVGIAGRATR